MERHRPQYHFLPSANWLNDPNGLIQWQGTYHLFYQHNPGAAVWGNMHWGHASSPDLVHWQHLPIALAPDPNGPDHDGVWSGCAVRWNGLPTFLYTGRDGERENVCLATSRDDLLTLEKYAGNPVIPGPPAELDQVGFRDPYLWQENGTWWMVVGSGLRDVGGVILLYSSPDLLSWRYQGILLAGDSTQHEPVWTGEMWECPNFFPLGQANGSKHMLMISPMDLHPSRSLYTIYFLGTFENGEFIPEHLAKMDGGDIYFYAPQAFQDEQGRRIAIGWSREARTIAASVAAGWAGVMTLPRLLDLGPDGHLTQRPVPELESLRGATHIWENVQVAPGVGQQGLLSLDGLSGDILELELVCDLQPARADLPGEFGLFVRRSPDGEELTEIRVDTLKGRLVVDTLRACLGSDDIPGQYEIPLDLTGLKSLTLRVFLDRSIIEVFANDTAVITARVYPAREDSTGIALFARRQPLAVTHLQMWEMGKAIS